MSRPYKPGDTLSGIFSVNTPAGASVNADSLPTAALYHSSSVDATVTVTVANLAVGLYSYSLTIPGGYALGDEVEVVATATVGGVTARAPVDRIRLTAPPTAVQVRQEMDANSTQLASLVSSVSGLAAAAAAAVWGTLTSTLTGVGSIGKLLAGYVVAPTTTQIAAGVLDASAAAHNTAGTVGANINAGATAADPWTTPLPGTYAAGTAGAILGGLGAAIAGIAAAVWSYVTRTVTQVGATVPTPLQGSTLTIRSGDTLKLSLTGLGPLTSRTALYFTVKSSLGAPDSGALIQVSETGGLLVLNGTPGTALQGSLVVDDATAGNVTITVIAEATTHLPPAYGLSWDVKVITPAAPHVLTNGTALVVLNVTQAIT